MESCGSVLGLSWPIVDQGGDVCSYLNVCECDEQCLDCCSRNFTSTVDMCHMAENCVNIRAITWTVSTGERFLLIFSGNE